MMKRGVCLVAVGLWVGGCAPEQSSQLPTAEVVVGVFEYDGAMEAEIVGNVAVLRVAQDPLQLRRGGSLWAKVAPYIFLFSAETQRLFDDYQGLAAVRVITVVGDVEVANAILAADDLNDLLWRRSLNISGLARRDGTERLTLLEDLVEWGERHTDFTYNERFTRR